MKIKVEYNFVDKGSLAYAVQRLMGLRGDHINNLKCVEPDRCDLIRELNWLIMVFKNVIEQCNEFESGVFELKRNNEVKKDE